MMAAMKPLQSTLLPPYTGIGGLRVATYNIHKGVRGVGPRKRLEIHNLGLAVEALDADLVFLQEVRLFHTREARRFDRTSWGWPEQSQAEFLAPEGYEVAYRSNAVTRFGEHGNALLSRWPLGEVGHHDVSDHRFEQRGLLHVPVVWNGATIHAVVVHFGLVHRSRVRQVERLANYIAAEVPPDAMLVVRVTSTTGAKSWTARCANWACIAPPSPMLRAARPRPFLRWRRCSRWTASTCVA
jgi:endonuclease/exonuclease/phosphatase family metal-dependent hydrolase